jgi:pimeloyl-ACP methyl ester carboxylesterase
MPAILLIHGAWHGAWCWSKLIAALAARGVEARAIDLPGAGDDPAPLQDVTLAGWADRIAAALDGFAVPPILLGHSMGGIAITAAAERAPGRIAALVYLCAFLPRDGDSLASLASAHEPDRVALRHRPTADGAALMVLADSVEQAFYGGCSATDVAAATARLRPLPLEPVAAPVTVTPERAGRVPRVYIECTEDRALPIEAQRAMASASPCRSVHSLATGHSPFLSMPERLADILAGIAGPLAG